MPFNADSATPLVHPILWKLREATCFLRCFGSDKILELAKRRRDKPAADDAIEPSPKKPRFNSQLPNPANAGLSTPVAVHHASDGRLENSENSGLVPQISTSGSGSSEDSWATAPALSSSVTTLYSFLNPPTTPPDNSQPFPPVFTVWDEKSPENIQEHHVTVLTPVVETRYEASGTSFSGDEEIEDSEESEEELEEDQEKRIYLDCWAFVLGQTDRAISLAIETYDSTDHSSY